jgi:hypothetical protein
MAAIGPRFRHPHGNGVQAEWFGRAYEGKFYQITDNPQIDTLGPLWHPWHPGWTGWVYWDSAPDYALIIHYTGHVVANLAGPDGKRMRCEF